MFVRESTTQKSGMLPAVVRGAVAGIIVFLLLVVVDQLSVRMGLTGIQRFGDDLLGGVIVGIIYFIDEQRRRRYLASRLKVIAEMNHHVRNALQAIKFAHQTEHQIQFINDAVARIEWALREVLPGEMIGKQQRTFIG